MSDDALVIEVENAAVFLDPDRRDLSEALGMLNSPGGDFLVISRADKPEVFVQAFRHGQDDWQVEYREGSADRHFQAEQNQARDRTERLLWGWMSADPTWRESISWITLDFADESDGESEDEPDRPAGTPRLVRIAREAHCRTSTIGTYRGGQFFADVVSPPASGGQVVLLHLFDAQGDHTESRLHPAADPGEADALLRSVLAGLDGAQFGDIRIHPFSVEVEGRTWGLLDMTALRQHEAYELEPQQLGFHAPWDGLYDT
ncbi:hypothetical protein OG196_00630 [Kitasatospora purpeofusca]|uniref:hypothetical protein n=1 Tax=Kitasatospora purpeofusca TaxID=67352 RepID=UPI002E0DE263|nr:hypothetical protein OG196_00630 [Kitasatospora purpeofusca]